MTTPVWLTGFEYGLATPVTSGGGLCDALVSTPVIVNTQHQSGSYALQLNLTGAAGGMYIGKNVANGGTLLVIRFYIRFETLPAADSQLGSVSMTDGNSLRWYYKQSSNQFQLYWDTGTVQTYSTTLSAGVWYRFDIRLNVSGNPHTCDWQVDGHAQTQATLGVAATTINSAGIRLGTSSTHTYNCYYDDVVCSVTTGDYPIGPGGTELLIPSADGSHNAGSNIMEDNAGTDIGATPAYDKINSVPMGNTTVYIKQANAGTGNYADVTLANISATHNGIIGAMAVLAYRAATATTDNGGCIITKDGFSTSTTIWGASGALADYSESSVFWKSVIVAGAIDDTTVNALEVRMGYSGDANPVPWWVDLAAEVAYTVASGLSGAVNQAAESDVAQAIARQKIKASGQTTETDSAQTVAPARKYAITQPSETDTAQAVTSRKIATVNQVTETDLAQPITRYRPTTTVNMGQASETDSAQAVTHRKIYAAGQAAETDSAQVVTHRRIYATGQAAETDSAQVVTHRKIYATGQAAETDSAQPINRKAGTIVEQAGETDLAQALFPLKRVFIAQASETDTAQVIRSQRIYPIGQASEMDAAQVIRRYGLVAVPVAQAVELEYAFPVTAYKPNPIGRVIQKAMSDRRKRIMKGDVY